MGIINASPESFYKGSIMRTKMQMRDAVVRMEQDGADIIDVGAMSTAPYLDTAIPARVETRRMLRAIRIIQDATNLPISMDTCRADVARIGMEHGVEILNDISGLKHDPAMPSVVSDYGPSVILCAFDACLHAGGAVAGARRLLQESIEVARGCGVGGRIAVDPAIGFFRRSGHGRFFTRIRTDWRRRDQQIIGNLGSIIPGFPVVASVSNKSVVGWLFDLPDPACRMHGSVTLEAICVINGAHIIRTHNVNQTKKAVRLARRVQVHVQGGVRHTHARTI